MRKFLLLIPVYLFLIITKLNAQVKIGDNPAIVNPNALLELESTNKGLLLPRLTTAQINAMTNVPKGLILFNVTDSSLYVKKDSGWSVTSGLWVPNGSNIFNTNFSNVGIGTSTPELKLSLDGDGGIMAKGTYGAGADITTAGAGARLIWYPKKAAFRAGNVNGTHWDKDSIGTYSFASGTNTKALGPSSTAMGSGTKAVSNFSTALGCNCTAIGLASTSVGLGNTAVGTSSFASGNSTQALGDYSTAMGQSTVANGYTSTALGYHATASGLESFAAGSYTVASGQVSTAIGASSTASGNYSTALGNFVSTNGMSGAFMLGDNSITTVLNSTTTNSFTARFAGGYNFFGDATATTANGLFFSGGNLGIGTLNNTPAYKLAVNGVIRSKEIRVESGWADFVFDNNYKLPSLNYVEKYIKANRHLPGILPAKEIQQNGLGVGEMQTKMMQKLEEVTLYLIEANKKIEELTARIHKLESQGNK